MPLWNPYQFCGTPFVANSQSAVFYPLNLLFVLLPTTAAFGASAGLHLVLTGWLMYGFLRSPALGLGRAAATLGAVVWQMSTWQASWLALPTFLCVSAWLPLALWLTDRLAAKASAHRSTALGACLGVMLLGGHLQIALYCLLLVAAYGLFRAYPAARADGTRLLPLAGAGLLALILMAGIAAPQVLPALELSRVSHRAGGPPTWAGYEGYTALAMPTINLVTLCLPGFFGKSDAGHLLGRRDQRRAGRLYRERLLPRRSGPAAGDGGRALHLAFTAGDALLRGRGSRRPSAGTGHSDQRPAVFRPAWLCPVRFARPHPGDLDVLRGRARGDGAAGADTERRCHRAALAPACRRVRGIVRVVAGRNGGVDRAKRPGGGASDKPQP